MSKVILESPSEVTGAERRRSHRAELVVRVDYATVDEMFSEFTRDINEGGLFIETEKPRPIGTEVTLHFNLPGSGEALSTVGRVVRLGRGDHSNAPGMGVEFEELEPDDRRKINSIIRALRNDAPAS